MKKFVALLNILIYVQAFAQEAYFLSHPTLTPNADKVVFSFESDLWIADTKLGAATRLTAMQGYETNAKVSPDGKWIAFTGRQYNNSDVYIMPIGGGSIQQLTYHSANDEVSAWSWDSKNIYFTSNRTGQQSGYTVSVNGGTPTRVLGNYYFQYDHLLMPHPTTGEIFFNDTWESSSQLQRKRYKGPFNPDIQSYNPTTKKHTKYTTWQGKDFHATIDKQGNIYCISDEANGQYNLYTVTATNKTALTKFTTSIKTPFVNANGGYIVFEKDYQLWWYDVKQKKESKLKIDIYKNYTLEKQQDFDVKAAIDAMDVSADGKKLVLASRGELFVSDAEGKYIQLINRNSTERVKEVKWMADNKTILFSQTKNGYSNWYTILADGSGTVKEITKHTANARNIALNKSRTKAVYLCGAVELQFLDLKTMENKLLTKQEFWAFQNSAPSFSPDDAYILFTAKRNFEEDVYVYRFKDNTVLNITNTDITESEPTWSPDGKYIYFTSQRLRPSYPFGTSNAKMYRLPLDKFDEPFKLDKYDELFVAEKKDTVKKDAVKTASEVVLNTDHILERIESIGPSYGAQYIGPVIQKSDKTTVLYISNHDEGRNAIWKTTVEPFEAAKHEKITGTDGVGGFDMVTSGDKLFVLANGTVHKLNLDQNKVDAINISYTYRKNLAAEFQQIFEETWATMQEGFYDEKMHGVDWAAIKKQYAQFIPHINNRADLRILLNDMLGELNASHQGFSTNGKDEEIDLVNRTMETGIIFSNANPYAVEYIVPKTPADKKGIDIKPGDKLIKVNSIAVDEAKDRSIYFTLPSVDREIQLTFTRNGNPFNVRLHTTTSLGNYLYDDWIAANQKLVNAKSNNSIAYGYMKDMGTGELEQFIIDMTQELNSKKALILDLRYNRGGNVHNEVLQFLSQKNYLNWKYRSGSITTQPNFTPADKPIVLLINEQSLSDAEMTAQGFKALKLGTIVGNATYRWIIFTSGVGLVDGSFVRMPAWGCYGMEGNNLEATGVEPDVKVINSFKDKVDGNDPQLEKAISVLLEKIK